MIPLSKAAENAKKRIEATISDISLNDLKGRNHALLTTSRHVQALLTIAVSELYECSDKVTLAALVTSGVQQKVFEKLREPLDIGLTALFNALAILASEGKYNAEQGAGDVDALLIAQRAKNGGTQ